MTRSRSNSTDSNVSTHGVSPVAQAWADSMDLDTPASQIPKEHVKKWAEQIKKTAPGTSPQR